MHCGVKGVLLVCLLFWATFALMVAAGLTASWMFVDSTNTSSGLVTTIFKFGPFSTCGLNTNAVYECPYITTSEINPSTSDADICPDHADTQLSSCSQARYSLLAIRISFIVFVVFQFFGALLCTIVPCLCVRGSTVFTYRRAKLLTGIAELGQILIVSLWYVLYQHYQNVDTFEDTLSKNSGTTRSLRFAYGFELACVSLALPIIASIIDCFIIWPPAADFIDEPAQFDGAPGVSMNIKRSSYDADGGPNGVASGPVQSFSDRPVQGQMSQPLVYAV